MDNDNAFIYPDDPDDPLNRDDWAEFIDEPADHDPYVAITATEQDEVKPADFWKARPVLAHLHDFARARRVGPWAVLGTVLARVVAATPPVVQIPPTIGSNASLNLFVGLVGKSGDGKDIAQKVARDALLIENEGFKTNPLGSGEGLSHMFMKPPGKGQDEAEQYNTAALVTIGEIDTLGALVKRQSSTISGQLRQAAMGEALGFFYVDITKRMMVPEHSYRLSLIAGIQPARSEVLLGEADGGTPQRFIWLPAGDPEAPEFVPPCPPPLTWSPPSFMSARQSASVGAREVVLPQVAIDTTVEARVQRLKETGEALDGHALLTRTKVAAALAILDGRYAVTNEDWHLSSVIMAVSDRQRARCQRALDEELRRSNVGKAVAEAERVGIVTEHVDKKRATKVAGTVRRRLAKVGAESPGRLRNSLASSDRGLFDDVIDALMVAGEVVEQDGKYSLS